MAEEIKEVPFTKEYVLKATAKHMRRDIDVSIKKTSDRIEELSEDRAKSEEVFKTLAALYALRKQIDNFLEFNQG